MKPTPPPPPPPGPYDAVIEYLESTGSQFIDTGLLGGLDTFYPDVKMLVNGEQSRYYALGNFNQAGQCGIMADAGNVSQINFVYYINNSRIYQTIGESGVEFSFMVDSERNMIAEGRFIGTLPDNTSKLTNSKLMLWGTGYGQPFNAYGKIFYLRLRENGSVLVRDFIPVRVGQEGYLYDKVSGQLFGNAGTGEFILGPDVG